MKSKGKIFFVLSAMLLSCNNQENEADANVETNSDQIISAVPAPNRMNEILWILGEWVIDGPDEVTYENWTQVDENLLKGECYMIVKETGDTGFYETVEIRHETTGLVYSPIVSDQNDGQPVNFLLTELNDSSVVFLNMQHDFPQKITYQLIGQDSLVAKVSGSFQGEELEDVYPYSRKKLNAIFM